MLLKISGRLIVPSAESTFLLFLYETRTLRYPQLPSHYGSSCFRNHYSTHEGPSEATGISSAEFVQDGNMIPDSNGTRSVSNSVGEATSSHKKTYLHRRATGTPASPPRAASRKSKSTVTRSEMKVFDKLFAQIASSPLPELRRELPIEKPKAKSKRISPSKATDESAQISSIFNDTIDELKHRVKGSVDNSAFSEAFPRRTSVSMRPLKEEDQVPKKLARLRSFNKNDTDGSGQVNQEQLEVSRIIHVVAQRECEKIEHELRSVVKEGKSDVELWKICEERIFGVLRDLEERITIEQAGRPTDLSIAKTTAGQSVHGKSARDIAGVTPSENVTDKQSQSESKSLEIPPSVPRNAVISTVYTRMLVVAIQLLKWNFPNSPLISEIRPTMHSYGRTSLVMGASTKLYNELIRFHWLDCYDMSTVVSLLKEMEEMGVEPDAKTYKTVRAIVAQQSQARRESYERTKSSPRYNQRKSSHTSWVELGLNKKAFRELAGSVSEEGWVQRIRWRLQQREASRTEDMEMRRIEQEDNEEAVHSADKAKAVDEKEGTVEDKSSHHIE